jgi:hypothetical protein
MIETLIDVLELLDRLAEKKYLPTRIWKLYRAVKGDYGTREDGTPRKNLRLREQPKKENK